MFHPLWPAGWLPPHLVFEPLAYLVGFQLYLWTRRRSGDVLDDPTRRWVVLAAIFGAAFGSKALFWLEDPAATVAHRGDLIWLWAGRTIVGGLLGGWVAVELAKKRLGVTTSTGDPYVRPLAFAMGIGRIGCFLSGVQDGTHGVQTTLPVGMDLGDGLLRHPTALYEIVVMLMLAFTPAGPRPGARFRRFLGAYLLWRLGVEFLKTQPAIWGGLSTIQVACVLGLLALARGSARRTVA